MIKPLSVHDNKITIATWLTILRILLSPCIMYALISDCWRVAFLLFVVASLSDLLDGYVARKRNEETALGAALDPCADKILLISVFFTLMYKSYVIPPWFFWLVVAKETVQICGFFYVSFYAPTVCMKPSMLGKFSTFAQLCFIGWLFCCYFCNISLAYVCGIGLLAITFLIIGVLMHYTYRLVKGSSV